MKIITTLEETVYKLTADSESIDFWKDMGFEVREIVSKTGKFQLTKVCPFTIKKEMAGLTIVQSKGMKGIANRWGCLLLPCLYDRVELVASNEGECLQKVHFMAFHEKAVEIYEYHGGMPIKVMSFVKLAI